MDGNENGYVLMEMFICEIHMSNTLFHKQTKTSSTLQPWGKRLCVLPERVYGRTYSSHAPLCPEKLQLLQEMLLSFPQITVKIIKLSK